LKLRPQSSRRSSTHPFFSHLRPWFVQQLAVCLLPVYQRLLNSFRLLFFRELFFICCCCFLVLLVLFRDLPRTRLSARVTVACFRGLGTSYIFLWAWHCYMFSRVWIGCTFSRVWIGYLFPASGLVTCFPASGLVLAFPRLDWLHVFPRLDR